MNLPSQVTAAALSTLVILFVAMMDSLKVIDLEPDQMTAVSAFVVASSNLGFGVLLWYVNRANPNPGAPAPENP